MAEIVRIEYTDDCPIRSCTLPRVKVTQADGRTFTAHDDGSWDGHPAWVTDSVNDDLGDTAR